MKFLFLVLVGIFTISPIIAHAESIINNNGIEISEEEYNNFLKIYTHEYIMTMEEEKYEKLKELDYSNIKQETKYVETTYNSHLNLTTEKEITEAEFDNYSESGISLFLGDRDTYVETVAKRLTMTVIGGTTWNNVVQTATWKGIPKVRSFDVIGFRGDGLEFRDGSQKGKQIYTLNGNYTVIDYSWNGTNIQRHDNGFGISMNIVNSDITALQLIVECDVSPTISKPGIFGSYQHAAGNVTLAESQNYTLGGSGLGGVFVYPYSISQRYDGMSGVMIEY